MKLIPGWNFRPFGVLKKSENESQPSLKLRLAKRERDED